MHKWKSAGIVKCPNISRVVSHNSGGKPGVCEQQFMPRWFPGIRKNACIFM